MTSRSTLKPAYADYSHLEPLPDPPRERDMQQDVGINAFRRVLEPHFAHRDDVLIAGGGFLRHEATNDAERLAPDCVVTFGVNPDAIVARNGYVISEVGKPPDFVLEVASRSTGRRDYTVKREGYAGYGVQEYWRFDRTGGRFHDAPLAGDMLVDGRYQPLPIHDEADGLIWGHSAVLGLDLCWDDGEFRLRNPMTGEFLPKPAELQAERDAAQVERDAALAEAARLREQLRRLQQD
jgi:hypothetical protein